MGGQAYMFQVQLMTQQELFKKMKVISIFKVGNKILGEEEDDEEKEK